MTEALLADLEARPDRSEVVDQYPARLWHPRGSRVLCPWRESPPFIRALMEAQ